MFVDKNILVSAIAEGKDPEVIAQEMMDALNEAISINKEAEKAAAAEQAQLEAAGILLAAFTSYITDYCPNMYASMTQDEEDLEPGDIVEIMAMMDEGFLKSKEIIDDIGLAVDNLFKMFYPIEESNTAGAPSSENSETPLKPAAGTSPKMPGSLLNFLKENGL